VSKLETPVNYLQGRSLKSTMKYVEHVVPGTSHYSELYTIVKSLLGT